MRKIFWICALMLVGFAFPSCSFLFPNKIFEAPKEYKYTKLSDSIPYEYVLNPGDKFKLFVYSNKGYKLVDPLIITSYNFEYSIDLVSLDYVIQVDGFVNLPMVGFVYLNKMNEVQAIDTLQKLYSAFYIDPYIQMQVINRRAIIYRGNEEAKVVELQNLNTTILEVIAKSGGIPKTGRSKKIQVVRTIADSVQISELDISTIEGIKQANTYVRPNDIIYIEPTINSEFFKEIAPIITAISGIVIIYAYFDAITKQ